MALRFLETGDCDGSVLELTYMELYRKALSVSATLQEHCKPGDRVLLLYPGGVEFLAAFYGCLFAGVIAVPAYPPDPQRPHRTIPRLLAIAKDAEVRVAISTESLLRNVQGLDTEDKALGSLTWLATDKLGSTSEDWHPHSTQWNDVAYLQYTSGSTGTPKGVVVDHGNLVQTFRFFKGSWPYPEHCHNVSWLPAFHDLGLIWGLLQPLYEGFPVTFMLPLSFVQKPLRWLEAISQFKGTHSAAPNFGYELCVRRVADEAIERLNLSSWLAGMNAAEPLRHQTVERFARRFQPAGFHPGALTPAYGLAEATLVVSVASPQPETPKYLRVSTEALEEGRVVPGEGESTTVLYSCGLLAGDNCMAIVDPATLQQKEPHEIGEMWVRSSSVPRGYWNRPKVNEEIFGARIQSAGEPELSSQQWMRTGDLGFLHEGEVFIVGRHKDLIIVRGRNVYPQDVEELLESAHPAVRSGCSAVFAIEAEGTEHVGAVVEVTPKRIDIPLERLLRMMKHAVSETFDLQLAALTLIPPRSLHKTSSGKIQRHRNFQAWEKGEFPILASWSHSEGAERVEHFKTVSLEVSEGSSLSTQVPVKELVQTLWNELPRVAKMEVLPWDVPLREFGLDSVSALELSGKLSESLGRPLPPTLLFEYPTLKALVHALNEAPVSTLSMEGSYPKRASQEPIAIISMACRLPGGANSPEQFWSNLLEGRDCISEVPRERWDVDSVYSSEPERLGASYSRWGGFLQGYESLDAGFFGVSPKEAVSMDPQQRLLLEASWEALERAGLTTAQLSGSRTGVFMGLCGSEYQQRNLQQREAIDAYSLLGSMHSTMVGRISYWLGLEGPNIAVDTACSSSLLAVHLAVQGLLVGDCDQALVGGANVLLDPEGYIALSRLRALSPTGRCHSFGENADGYVRAEGCGVLLLKRLSDAERDGDSIVALIRGTASNQDGRSQGLTAPRGAAQESVIREALSRANAPAHTVSYVECHGTGTPLGDLIEVQALDGVFQGDRAPDNPLWIGSVKSNIGHTEAAAGIAGLIKTALCLQHSRLPQTLHCEPLNLRVPWDQWKAKVVARPISWESGQSPRRAGVSSFGLSGTNVHVVVEEAPSTRGVSHTEQALPSSFPIVVSGHNSDAVVANADRLHQFLLDCVESSSTHNPGFLSLANLSYSLATRTAFSCRKALPVSLKDAKEGYPSLRQSLRQLAVRGFSSSIATLSSTNTPKLVMLFSGQGSQYVGMGQDLYQQVGCEAFTEAIDEAFSVLNLHLEHSLADVMWTETADSELGSLLGQTHYTQPALFALEVALFAQWKAWGIVPDLLLGHSIGELVAAYVAGVFSLEDAATLVCARGRLMQECAKPNGSMASLEASEAEVREVLSQLFVGEADKVSIAGLNTPTQTVISGDEDAVELVVSHVRKQGRRTKLLRVSHAFHSAHMDGMLDEFREVASRISYQNPSIPVLSNVSGQLANTKKGDLVSAEYWTRHIRQAVRFADNVSCCEQGERVTFLECGPGSILAGMTASILSRSDEPMGSTKAVATLHQATRNDEWGSLIRAICHLFELGHECSNRAFFQAWNVQRLPLPTYAFQRQRYWLDAKQPTRFLPSSDPGEVFWDLVTTGNSENVAELLGLSKQLSCELTALLPHLKQWKTQTESDATVQPWCYEEKWVVASEPEVSGVISSGTSQKTYWLVSEEESEESRQNEIQQVLLGSGVKVERLTLHQCLDRLQTRLAQKKKERPQSTEDVGLSLDASLEEHCILFLISTSVQQKGPSVERKKPWGAMKGALALAQVIHQLRERGTYRLWLLTPHLLSVQKQTMPGFPEGQALCGFARSLSLAAPQSYGGLIDLPHVLEPSELSSLATVLLKATLQWGDEFAVRDGKVWVRRIVRAKTPVQTESWSSQGTVLVTGGTGALGAHIARWVVDKGATHLVLTSRRGRKSPGAEQLTEELSAQGCVVSVETCDSSKPNDVRKLVQKLSDTSSPLPPLKHIFHAAGVASETPLHSLTLDALELESAGKVRGAWLLHKETEGQGVSLSSFVMFGSVSGLWGNGSQIAYAASNAGLSGVMEYRRAKGMAASVIHWGPWDHGGMVTPELAGQLRQQGLLPMEPLLALRAMERVLNENRSSFVVADIDWERFSPTFSLARPRPLFAEIEDAVKALQAMDVAEHEGEANTHVLRRTLMALPASERLSTLKQHIIAEALNALGAEPGTELPWHMGFLDLGFDSLLAVEFRKRLQQRTGVSIPATIVFDQPNLEALTQWLLQRILEVSSGALLTSQKARHRSFSAPIAIVGVGLRMPGGATDLESLWNVLSTEQDTLSEIPPERFDLHPLYNPDPEHRGSTYVRHASLLDDVGGFDADFFGISPREALPMDPQHRLLLEASWTALEHAGIAPGSLEETSTGLFVGIGPNEYASYRGRAFQQAEAYDLTGKHTAFAAGRLAYHLGLQGPALSMDTACSSSLVALHLAAEHLRSGRCDLALAGGVQVLADPEAFVLLSSTRAVSPDGRCKTFSAAADGYGRGEGVGVLALMRLDDALEQQRHILGVVRGTAVNHDGASAGITAPNGGAQQRVIQDALNDANLQPSDVDVVECHGTGTSLGDPIEVQALQSVFGEARKEELGPLRLGAVKTNLGHLESAAGVAGILKVLASFHYEAIPPTLHCSPPNPHLDWEKIRLQVVDTLTPWPRQEQRARRAGVSAFGLSGTNAHVLLEEPPASTPPVHAESMTSLSTLPVWLSGESQQALQDNAIRLAGFLSSQRDTPLHWMDLTYSLAATRTPLKFRLAVSVSSKDAAKGYPKLCQSLALFGKEGAQPLSSALSIAPSNTPKLVMLFSGQGSQYVGMGKDLYQQVGCEAFTEAIDEAFSVLNPHLEHSLADVMWTETADSELGSLLGQTHYTQPALFALEVALFAQWKAWGIVPDLLLGHSIGELVAAYVAGVFSLEDAATLVCARGRLMQECAKQNGSMASLEASEAEVREVMSQLFVGEAGKVSIAGLNTPTQTVISGDKDAVEALVKHFSVLGHAKGRKRRAKLLRVSHAFHSAHMDGMLDEFREVASQIRYLQPGLTVLSNVTGQRANVERGDLVSAEYWVQHVRQAVRFVENVNLANTAGDITYLECGPGRTLAGMVGACLEQVGELQDTSSVITSFGKNVDSDSWESLVQASNSLFVRGHQISAEAFFQESGAKPIPLPTYSFQHQSFWLPPKPVHGHSTGPSHHLFSQGLWPLTGDVLALPDGSSLHTLEVSPSIQTYLADHLVYGQIVVPGAFFVSVLLAVAAQHYPEQTLELRELQFHQALVFDSVDDLRTAQIHVSPCDADGMHPVVVSVRDEGDWTTHLSANFGALRDVFPSTTTRTLDSFQFQPLEPTYHERVMTWHVERRERLRWVHGKQVEGDTCFGKLKLPPGVPGDDAPLDGGMIDASFTLAVTHEMFEGMNAIGIPYLPFRIENLYCRPDATQVTWMSSSAQTKNEVMYVGDINWFSSSGELLGAMKGFTAHRAPLDRFLGRGVQHKLLYQLRGVPLELPGEVEVSQLSPTFVIHDASQLKDALPVSSRLVLDLLHVASMNPETLVTGLMLQLQERLANVETPLQELLVCTRGGVCIPPHDPEPSIEIAAVWGMLRTLRGERPELKLRLLDLDHHPDSEKRLQEALQSNEPESVLRQGAWSRLELVSHSDCDTTRKQLTLPEEGAPYALKWSDTGLLEELKLEHVPEVSKPLSKGEVRVAVRSAGLNFRDVLSAMGSFYGQRQPLGGEFAGVVVETTPSSPFSVGERVFGLASSCLATEVRANGHALASLPKSLSFAEAATLPAAFLTAVYAFKHLAKLRAGQRVLIHAGTGGVGMAAIQYALMQGAEVFATASPGKWPVLESLGVKPTHIASSRNLTFESKFMGQTQGQGVDVILNSLIEHFVDASLRLLPRGGHFLDMGKRDVRDAEQVASDYPGVSYQAFDLLDCSPALQSQMLTDVVQGVAAQKLSPLPYQSYDLREATQAFQWMAQAKHTGKLVFSPPPSTFKEQVRETNGTVLVTGATGGIGRVVTEHLVQHHGVQHLLLLSRSGKNANGAEEWLQHLAEMGAKQVRLESCDVRSREAIDACLDKLPSANPVVGIFHTAGVLRDAAFEAQTSGEVHDVLSSKLETALHLDAIAQSLPSLHAFVLFSSASGAFGNPGQASYAAANAGLDALAIQRKRKGLPATSIAWGPWNNVGMLANLSTAHKNKLRESGLQLLDSAQALQAMDVALEEPSAVFSALSLERSSLSSPSAPLLLRSLATANKRSGARGIHSSRSTPERFPLESLALMSSEERYEAVLQLVRSEVRSVLQVEDIPSDRPIHELGLDSLMAVELRNHLGKKVGVRLPSTLLFDYPTPVALVSYLMEEVLPETSLSSSPDVRTTNPSTLSLDWAALQQIPEEVLVSSGALPLLMDLLHEQSKPVPHHPSAPLPNEDASDQEFVDQMAAFLEIS